MTAMAPVTATARGDRNDSGDRNGSGDRNSFTGEMGIAVIVSANNPGVNGPVSLVRGLFPARHPATWEFTREHCLTHCHVT